MAFFTTSKEDQQANSELLEAVTDLKRQLAIADQQVVAAHSELERLHAQHEGVKDGNKKLRKVIREMTETFAQTLQQQRHDFSLQIVELQARVTGLTARAETAQANFEWARLMFNKGEAERAILTARIIERPVQPFTIDREAAPPPPTDGTAGEAGRPKAGVDRPIPVGAATETAIGGLMNRLGDIFEDVGDEEARSLGIEHPE